MYLITAAYSHHSFALRHVPTMREAYDAQAELSRFYAMVNSHNNTKICIDLYCDTCTEGRVFKCSAPKRHADGYHSNRCYKVCPMCKGKYATRIDG
jgi:hypothetical protein